MAASSVWRMRWNNSITNMANFVWVAVIYLASELVIWGLSRTLSPAGLEFFASILGMVLIFSLATAAFVLWRSTDSVYDGWIKDKVDFINANLGLGFPVPIIMLDQGEILDSHDIARVIGTFVTTNLVSWVTVFLLSILTLTGIMHLRARSARWNSPVNTDGDPGSTLSKVDINSTQRTQEKTQEEKTHQYDSPKALSDCEKQTPSSSRQTSCERDYTDNSSVWTFLAANYAIFLSFACAIVIGVPLAVTAHDDRFIDGFSLWFIWIASVKAQRAFKKARVGVHAPYLQRAVATIMNPVLLTTLLMMGYTRAKASGFGPGGLGRVLKTFCSGTPLYALWTAAVNGTQLPGNPSGWFGAGDAAVSILECGILTWGFKLSECRRQIFSVAGLLTVIICTAAAVGNVFLSVLAAQAMGLDTPEALSFAARCTTLALAKPATEAIAGNTMVNATLVVSNGILGQLMYPFALDKLGVVGEKTELPSQDVSCETLMRAEDGQLQPSDKKTGITRYWCQDFSEGDSPITIAAGIAIGINGAAMGVSYLYETKSRAAPYAALSMTIFGVMTVVFTTVEPFKGVVVDLASH